ncbi:MAG: hypothetical protein FJX19_10150 [Alphaproteobacteria bacterium]|nr:hypothetical protein [Alphaproteobacteria bacterium]
MDHRSAGRHRELRRGAALVLGHDRLPGARRDPARHDPRPGDAARRHLDEERSRRGRQRAGARLAGRAAGRRGRLDRHHLAFRCGDDLARRRDHRRLSRRTRGVRIVVSGALEMSLVAAGRMDAFVHVKADIVSHAAAMPLVRAAGGRVTTLSGADAVVDDLERVASNGLVHDELLDAIAGS